MSIICRGGSVGGLRLLVNDVRRMGGRHGLRVANFRGIGRNVDIWGLARGDMMLRKAGSWGKRSLHFRGACVFDWCSALGVLQGQMSGRAGETPGICKQRACEEAVTNL
jgi:hypothetical protein